MGECDRRRMDKILFAIRRTYNNSYGVNVSVTEMSSCQFYDAPYYYRNYLYKTNLKEFKYIDTEEILRFLTEGKEMWT
ncbi:hypothetical protein Goklo_017662 [Gossypium klotzschianum]|uniref:Uncharacterized protein n=1 Tax=Gossypium klotzschianum TaxID=34286 RepID=A0A7J8UIY3_9ROSI|nr:hypothetical protein [Gossypium klotzschianum]